MVQGFSMGESDNPSSRKRDGGIYH